MMELDRCPFCGGEVHIVYVSAENLFHVYHRDKENIMLCPILEPFRIDAISLADAGETWNTRYDMEQEVR